MEKHSKLGGIRPLAEAASICGAGPELVDMPHYKTGEVLVRVAGEFRKAPPDWLIAAHGDIVDLKANPATGLAFVGDR